MDTEHRVVRFLRECVMPVAISTGALVLLGQTNCSLSRAFGHMCQVEADKCGGKLPSTVMFISNAVGVRGSAPRRKFCDFDYARHRSPTQGKRTRCTRLQCILQPK
jgi:hypothetical protein